jgi:hypothetical protein
MDRIAFNVPGYKSVPTQPLQVGPGNGIEEASLGGVVSGFLGLIFYIALFITFFWFIWGVYEYLAAQGQKEALATARDRIKWSIIGFVVLVMAFLVGNYAMTIFPFLRPFYNGNAVPFISRPPGDTTL